MRANKVPRVRTEFTGWELSSHARSESVFAAGRSEVAENAKGQRPKGYRRDVWRRRSRSSQRGLGACAVVTRVSECLIGIDRSH